MLPDFVIIGAAKAGTTALSEYLAEHPQVFMSRPKELQFFSRSWDQGVAWYERFFDDAGPGQVRGEASPQYARAPQVPDVPARMVSVLPDAKLIYLVRQPIDRIRSHYAHWVDLGQETRPFPEAVRENRHFIDTSRYAFQLGLYLEHYPRERLLVLSAEQLRADRAATFARVCRFLEVDDTIVPANLTTDIHTGEDRRRAPTVYEKARALLKRSNVLRLIPTDLKRRLRHRLGRPIPPAELVVTPELEQWIWSELAADLAQLRTIVGPDFDLWGRA